MFARIRRERQERDEGFTLIELLVVMIIIGILASIAVPIFLSQRQKAHDAAAKADVSKVGKEIATFFIGGTGVPAIDTTTVANHYTLTSPVPPLTTDLGVVSRSNQLGPTFIVSDTAWCVTVTNPNGDRAAAGGFSYSAANGLAPGACLSANG